MYKYAIKRGKNSIFMQKKEKYVESNHCENPFYARAGNIGKDTIYYPDGWDKFTTANPKIIQKDPLFF